MNKPVSFELAKLLKEKGYNKRTPMVWLFSLGETHLRELHLSLELNDAEYNAPTIAEVVMWCFNKYKYSIEYSMNIPESGEYDGCYVFNGLIKGSENYKLKIFYTSKDYPTVEKALEDTINHFLITFC